MTPCALIEEVPVVHLTQELPKRSAEPETSLPCPGPYPEPDQSSPYRPILSLLRSISILSILICLRSS
jgi:hypothetical protein